MWIGIAFCGAGTVFCLVGLWPFVYGTKPWPKR
jgi:hypothetical protein